ncbi:MAG: hypothetical protein ABEJ99_04065 [Candidatus Nanohaloarchaea archaeon]
MNEDAVFKRYDVRGKYPGELDEEFCRRMGKALGTFSQKEYSGEIVVCRDNKQTSMRLREAVIEGLISTGTDVYVAGTGTTDYAAFVGRIFDAVSVQVTSSHLSLDTNGLKFMYPEGNGFVNRDLDQLERLFRQQEFSEGRGNRARVEKASRKQYIDEMKGFLTEIPGSFQGKKIVVDTMGGAATEVLPDMLEELGAVIIDVSEEKPERPYYDPPDPKPEMLEKSRKRMEEENADLLLANDMDADRVAAYNGRWISGDEIFGVFTQLFENVDIVGSLDTSRAVDDLADIHGSTLHRTRVGDPFVMEKALETAAALTGEPNGHYAFLDFVPYNSGILSALVLAKIDLETYLDNVPDYHTLKKDIEVEDKQEVMKKIKAEVGQRYGVISETDGVKFSSGSATVLVRSSGSSEVIRLKAESQDKEEAEQVMDEAEALVRNQ